MRKGVIDQILMMLMVFVFLVTLFFIVVDYSSVGKVQNQLDIIARQGSRFVSLGKDEEKIAEMINTMKTNYFMPVTVDDIVCERVPNNLYKVIFNVRGTFHSRFKEIGNDGNISVSAVSVAYNEYDSDEINCSVRLQKEGSI